MLERDQWLTVAMAIIIVVSGTLITLYSVGQEDASMRRTLLTESRIAAGDINPNLVEALLGSSSDLTSPEYSALKEQMKRTRAADPGIRFAYLMGQRPDGSVFFFVDSEPPESEDYSPPGQTYDEATPLIITAFATGKEMTGGPDSDRWGTWVSSMVPVYDPATSSLVALFGMDIAAGEWTNSLLNAAIPGVLGTLLFLVLLFSFSIIYRRGKREQARVEESEKVHRTIFENTGTATIQVEEDNTISRVNSTFEHLIGYDRGEIEGRMKWTEFVHPDDVRRMEEFHRIRMDPDGRAPIQYEFRLFTKDRRQKDILLSVGLLPGTRKTIASLFDLTDKKELERIARESEEHYQQIFNLAKDGITVVSDGIIRRCNVAFSTSLGYPMEELCGQSIMKIIHPDDAHIVMDRHHRRLGGEQGLPSIYTFRVIRGDGAILWVELNTSVVEWEGRPATLNMVRDITDRKKIEEALSQANQKLNLLSSITRHDVMNQLLVLRGYLDLSREVLGDSEAMQRYIDNEISGVRLIERQILFTKDYQDMGVKSPVWQDLDMVLVHARGSLSIGNITIEQQHTNVKIFADPLLEKVFFNLIDNALRHGGEKMTTIRVSTHETDHGLSIVIEDDGAGIPPEFRSSLFSRGIGTNTGFGLFLAREILSITNIAITETSEQGKGARFEILVPKEAYRFD